MKSKSLQVAVMLVVVALAHAYGAVFYNPIINSGADPSCTYWNGNYYYMDTFGGLSVRKASKLTGPNGIGGVSGVSVFTPQAPYNQNVWAPELHYINGNWYIYYTAGTANDSSDTSHRIFCLKANTQDPQGSYTFMGEVRDPNSDFWSIDPSILQKDDGSLYFIWCSRAHSYNDGVSRIYIAPMSNPWTLSGSRVLISSPTYSWEANVNEAPQFIEHNGALDIVYAANCTCGNNYCLGMVQCNDGNVLNSGSWGKNSTPILQSYVGSDGSVYAPGSCTFTKSEDGTEDWVLFHTAQYSGSGFIREVHAQSFGWNEPWNTPNFGHPIPDSVPERVPSGEAPVELTTTRNSQLRLQDGRLQVFVCQYPDGSVWTRSENTPGGSWGPWISLGGSGFRRLDAMQWTDGTMTLFGVGDYTPVWINWQNSSNGPWTGFYSLVDSHGNGASFNDFKAFKYNDGRCSVFGMDGNQVWSRSQFSVGSAWGDWGAFSGTGFTQVSPIKLPDDTFVMFGVGNGTAMWINWQLGFEQPWSGWESMGGSNLKNVRTFRYNDGRLSVFAGDGNVIYNVCQYTNVDFSHWGPWGQFDGSGITQYEPIKLSDERFALLAVSGGSIWQNTQTNVGQGWSGWSNLGGSGFSKVEGNQLPDGRLYYFGNGGGSPEWLRYQAMSNGAWNVGWTNLGESVY